MTDQSQSARDDLAFMRAIAEDHEPLPWGFGAHLFVPGVLFSPTAFLAWAQMSGLGNVPVFVLQWLWAPTLLLWAAIWVLINRRAAPGSLGPRKRAFAAAWNGMGLMTGVAIISLLIATFQSGSPFLLIWPSIALGIYGGAWAAIASMQQRPTYWLVACGAFATAIACAFLVEDAAQWLIMGFGILAWIAAPGLLIMLRARRPA